MSNNVSSCPWVSLSPRAGIADIPQHWEDAAASLWLFLAGRQEAFQEGTDGGKKGGKELPQWQDHLCFSKIHSRFSISSPALAELQELGQGCPGKGGIFLPSTLGSGF